MAHTFYKIINIMAAASFVFGAVAWLIKGGDKPLELMLLSFIILLVAKPLPGEY